MIIAIISDTHFGFKENDEAFALDSYVYAQQAFDLAIENNAELILMPGDIFDLEIPSQETLDNTFKILHKLIGNQELKVISNKKTITKIPIITIPGTHEYRGKQYKGPIDILESAGYIYNLNNNHIIIKNDKEKVAIFGMKGVPEKVSRDLLKKLNFKPIEDATNILLLHQSFKEFLPFEDDMVATLSIEDLPDGFDLYVDGHIHLSNIINTEKGLFVLPGSTILTQIKKKEIEKRKGIVIFNTETKEISFKELPIQRDYFLKEINIKDATKEEAYDKIKETINNLNLETKKYTLFGKEIILKPVIKIKLKGDLLSGYKTSDIKQKDFENNNYIFILEKELNIKSLEEKIQKINIEEEKEKALKNSLDIFIKNLSNAGFKNSFNPEELITLLKNDDQAAIDYILKINYQNKEKKENQKTLFNF